MNPSISPQSTAHMVEQYVQRMRLRDRLAELQSLRIDCRILECEAAVDQVFARANFEARS